nr:hypothetical protein [Mesorhizobium neociceri]
MMTRPLSNDLRERAVAAVLSGESRRSAAKRFGISVSAAVKLLQRHETTGSVAPGKMGGHEQAFAKIKHWMRQAQKRTVEDTWHHIGHLVETIEPGECKNYFANAGYASIKT